MGNILQMHGKMNTTLLKLYGAKADLGNILIKRILYHIPILGQKRILYHINILKKFVIYIISYIISFFGGKI